MSQSAAQLLYASVLVIKQYILEPCKQLKVAIQEGSEEDDEVPVLKILQPSKDLKPEPLNLEPAQMPERGTNRPTLTTVETAGLEPGRVPGGGQDGLSRPVVRYGGWRPLLQGRETFNRPHYRAPLRPALYWPPPPRPHLHYHAYWR